MTKRCNMRLLFIGDIVGRPGREAVGELLPGLVQKHKIGCVIANAENAAGGSGITPPIAEELAGYGCDALTSGDHIWKRKEASDLLERYKNVLRPLNYPEGAPGEGSLIMKTHAGVKRSEERRVGKECRSRWSPYH